MFGMLLPRHILIPLINYQKVYHMDSPETVICYRGNDGKLYETMTKLKEGNRQHILFVFFRKHGANKDNLVRIMLTNWDELKKILEDN